MALKDNGDGTFSIYSTYSFETKENKMKPHKHAEVIKAFADGHEIEIRIFDTNTDKWLLWHSCDLFTLSQAEKFPDTYLQLRIKQY